MLFLRVSVLIASALQGTEFAFAQTNEPPSVPAALLVKDRFDRAVKNQSSAPTYLMVTIVNDTTGERKQVCIESIQLYAGVRKENKLGRDNWDGVIRLILGNASRTYHFTIPDAWAEVQPRYTPETRAAVEEALRPVSTAELAERFSYARTGGLVQADKSVPAVEFYGYLAATACVLTERGLLAGRGDFGNSLYVITPQMLAERDLRDRRIADFMRLREAKARAFAARLPGYGALTKQFSVKNASMSDFRQGFCLWTSLDARSPRTVDSFGWLDPVSYKTGNARYDWNRFLLIAAHVERLARQHPWLQKWKVTGPNRTIEVQMYGKNIHTDSDEDIKKDIMPAWKDAGLVGKPYCQVGLRWRQDGESAYATVFLPQPGSGENRSLIVSSSRPDAATTVGPGLHWLDRLPIRSYAAASTRQAVVVAPKGEWKLLTLPTRRPAPKP